MTRLDICSAASPALILVVMTESSTYSSVEDSMVDDSDGIDCAASVSSVSSAPWLANGSNSSPVRSRLALKIWFMVVPSWRAEKRTSGSPGAIHSP
ncbi:hypothetical protein D3C71_1852350 [compost metagenome]